MKQYRITTANLNLNTEEDCVLDPNDPIHKLIEKNPLAAVGNPDVYYVYPAQSVEADHKINPYSQV
jgi:hypothetical protein